MTPLKSSIDPFFSCSDCKVHELCLPGRLSRQAITELQSTGITYRRVRRGEKICRTGQELEYLFAIRVGTFKSSITSSEGHEQVIGFHLPGDLMGLDAIADQHHNSDITALEDAIICLIPFKGLEQVLESVPVIHLQFMRLMSLELVRKQTGMLMLGSMHADERLATFLLNFSERYKERGFSCTEFCLRMTRAEIGSYLGLKLETVSRVMSKLAESNLVEIHQKNVHILDLNGLKSLLAKSNAGNH